MAQAIPVDVLTNLVNRRYYFVERLKKTIEALSKIHINSDKLSIVFNPSIRNSIKFTVPQVRNSLEKIYQEGTLKPLFQVWEDFAAYKNLDDEILIEEFTKEVFVVTYAVLVQATKSIDAPIQNRILEICEDLELEDLLDLIDEVVISSGSIEKDIFCKKNKLKSTLSDLVFVVPSENIILRYCANERLNWVFDLFKEIEKGTFFASIAEIFFIDSAGTIENSLVKQIITEINIGSNLSPLYELWRSICEYRFIKNRRFQKDFLRLIVLIEYELLKYFDKEFHDNNKMKETIFPNILNDFSDFDLLYVIDIMGKSLEKVIKEEKKNFWSYFTALFLKLAGYKKNNEKV